MYISNSVLKKITTKLFNNLKTILKYLCYLNWHS